MGKSNSLIVVVALAGIGVATWSIVRYWQKLRESDGGDGQEPEDKGVLCINALPSDIGATAFINGVGVGGLPSCGDLGPGKYQVSFSNVEGWITPLPVMASVVKDQTITVTGTYIEEPPPNTGTLSIDTAPVKGQVLVNGTVIGMAPVIAHLVPGSYLVGFGNIPRYLTPQETQFAVVAGEVTTVLGEYVLESPVEGAVCDITDIIIDHFIGNAMPSASMMSSDTDAWAVI